MGSDFKLKRTTDSDEILDIDYEIDGDDLTIETVSGSEQEEQNTEVFLSTNMGSFVDAPFEGSEYGKEMLSNSSSHELEKKSAIEKAKKRAALYVSEIEEPEDYAAEASNVLANFAPDLISPVSKYGVDVDVLLRWMSVPNADEYVWVLATDKEFQNEVASGITTATQVKIEGLLNGVQYYWKVSSRVRGNTSLPSSSFFKTDATPEDFITISPDEIRNDTSVTVTVKELKQASSYEFWVSDSPETPDNYINRDSQQGRAVAGNGSSLYLDTGLKPAECGEIVIVAKHQVSPNLGAIFGARTEKDGKDQLWYIGYYAMEKRFIFRNNSINPGEPHVTIGEEPTEGQIYTHQLISNTGTYNVYDADGNLFGSGAQNLRETDVIDDQNIYILARNEDGQANHFTSDIIYDAKLYSPEGTLIRHYDFSCVTSDGKVLERVSKTFSALSGFTFTDDFIVDGDYNWAGNKYGYTEYSHDLWATLYVAYDASGQKLFETPPEGYTEEKSLSGEFIENVIAKNESNGTNVFSFKINSVTVNDIIFFHCRAKKGNFAGAWGRLDRMVLDYYQKITYSTDGGLTFHDSTGDPVEIEDDTLTEIQLYIDRTPPNQAYLKLSIDDDSENFSIEDLYLNYASIGPTPNDQTGNVATLSINFNIYPETLILKRIPIKAYNTISGTSQVSYVQCRVSRSTPTSFVSESAILADYSPNEYVQGVDFDSTETHTVAGVGDDGKLFALKSGNLGSGTGIVDKAGDYKSVHADFHLAEKEATANRAWVVKNNGRWVLYTGHDGAAKYALSYYNSGASVPLSIAVVAVFKQPSMHKNQFLFMTAANPDDVFVRFNARIFSTDAGSQPTWVGYCREDEAAWDTETPCATGSFYVAAMRAVNSADWGTIGNSKISINGKLRVDNQNRSSTNQNIAIRAALPYYLERMIVLNPHFCTWEQIENLAAWLKTKYGI